jgi:putative sterol carrier protein
MQRFHSIHEVMASYPARFYAEKAIGVDGILQFVFTGEEGGSYYLFIRDQEVCVEEGDYPDPTVTVTAPAEAWLRVSNGEINPMGLLMRGQLKVKGSLAMATKFQSLFRPGSEL